MEASGSYILIMGAANSGYSHFWIPPVMDATISGYLNCGYYQLWMPPVMNTANWFAF